MSSQVQAALWPSEALRNVSLGQQSTQVGTAQAQFMRDISAFAQGAQTQCMVGGFNPIASLSSAGSQTQRAQLASLLLSNTPSVFIAYVEVLDASADVVISTTSVTVPAEAN